MDKYNTTDKNYWRNFATRFSIILATVILIVWFLPRESGPQFRYDVGKPWMYGSLIARFDFPIYKTDEAIKAEQDSIINQFEPYYSYDTDKESVQIERFRKKFANGIPGLPDSYIPVITDRLHRLYQAGVMNPNEYAIVSKDSTSMVRVIIGKKATSIQANCIYSTMTAYEQLFADEKLRPYRQVLQPCNLNEYIVANISYDKERSETERNDLLSSIAIASGMVLTGQKIIDRGEIVDSHTYRVLSSFEREMTRRSATSNEIPSTIAGQVLFVSILMILFTCYLVLFRKDYFDKPRSVLMLYAMITIFPILVSLMMSHVMVSVYVLPSEMPPLFFGVVMDSRTGFISHVVMVLICAAAVKYQYEFIIIQLVAGLVAIYSLRELSQRAQVFKTAVLVFLSSCAIYFALQLMQDNSVLTMDQSMYVYFAINGVFVLFAYPLMLVVEKTFGFISNVTLVELSNTSKDLLRQLSEVAPGTFQHSIMVSNLAVAIANKIDAKAQEVRTGALYRDIGKMSNPAFFTENQAGKNPLEKMNRTDAAKIVINHVTEGLRLADKYNLPGIIKDFTATHHGNGITKYFYSTYQNEHPNDKIDPTPFTYPGPNPFSREQAILMMADTVEAASRSLPEYTAEAITNLVNRLIDGQVSDGYFRDCPITFHDINVAKQVLIERLKTIYHTRISYPELKGKEKKQNSQAQTSK